MRIPNWLLILSVALLCTQSSSAQQASPEQIQKALEVLRSQEAAPSQPAKQPIQVQSVPVETGQPKATIITSTVVTPANNQPATQVKPATPEPATTDAQKKAMELLRSMEKASPATTDAQKKAIELLRSIETASPTPGSTTVQPSAATISDQERDAAIRSAIKEAEIIVEQQQNARQQNPRAVSEAEMQQEINRIETEILRAKGAQPTLITPETSVIKAETIPSTPPPTTTTVAPSPVVQSTVPVTRLTPAIPVQPVDTQPNLIPMTTTEEQNARRLLEQTAPRATPKKPLVASPVKTITSPVVVKPTVAPKPALSGNKEQKLAELLRRYKNDEVSPAAYHKERAKILAGP